MGHADDDFLGALFAGALDEFVHHRDERLAALERKAFLADKLFVQVGLHALGTGEQAQDVFLFLHRVARIALGLLDAFLDEGLLGLVRQVHVLDADRRAVGVLQPAQNLVQRQGVRGRHGAGVEQAAGVALGEAVVGDVERLDALQLHHAERVDIGAHVTVKPIGVDQTQNRTLLGHVLRVVARAGRAMAAEIRPVITDVLDDLALHIGVAHVAAIGAFAIAEPVEITSPVVGHRAGIVEELFVQRLHEWDVGGIKGRMAACLVHERLTFTVCSWVSKVLL